MRGYINSSFAEGVAWKFAPVRIAPHAFEFSLDNDLIFWRTPAAVDAWLSSAKGCVHAQDVRPCFGKFAGLCGAEPRNSGICGLPPGFGYEARLQRLLERNPPAGRLFTWHSPGRVEFECSALVSGRSSRAA
jgi:hypothetical protein